MQQMFQTGTMPELPLQNWGWADECHQNMGTAAPFTSEIPSSCQFCVENWVDRSQFSLILFDFVFFYRFYYTFLNFFLFICFDVVPIMSSDMLVSSTLCLNYTVYKFPSHMWSVMNEGSMVHWRSLIMVVFCQFQATWRQTRALARSRRWRWR